MVGINLLGQLRLPTHTKCNLALYYLQRVLKKIEHMLENFLLKITWPLSKLKITPMPFGYLKLFEDSIFVLTNPALHFMF